MVSVNQQPKHSHGIKAKESFKEGFEEKYICKCLQGPRPNLVELDL